MTAFKREFEIARRMAKALTGELTREEREQWEAWLGASAEHRALWDAIRAEARNGVPAWPYSREEVEGQLERFYRRMRRGRRRRLMQWTGWAAAAVLVVGFGWWMWPRGEGRNVVRNVPERIVLLPGDGVELVLSTGERVDVRKETATLEGNARYAAEEKALRYEGGADTVEGEMQVQYNTLIVPRGGDFKVELADGTMVWLNSCTRLRYPVDFKGDAREVWLEGEAYFEVARDEAHPFVVHAEEVGIRVLGTRFNVLAYEGEAEVATTLEEGSVAVVMPTGERVIRPDEQLVFDRESGEMAVREVDAGMYSAWKDGMFVFENETLERIMDRLRLWYDVEVFFSSEAVREVRFTGDLQRYEDFTPIVSMLEEVAGVDINVNGKCIIIGAK